MRLLTIVVVVLAALYSGYWWLGARAVAGATESQITQLRADGWTVEYDALDTKGYPSRFDTTATNLTLSSPDAQVQYSAPRVQALALSYQPNRVILAFPDAQAVTVPQIGTVDVTSSGLRASAEVGVATSLPLRNFTAEALSMTLETPVGLEISLQNLLGALREGSGAANTYDVYLGAQDIAPPAALMAQINRDGLLPETLSVAKIDATVTLDRPLNRESLSAWQGDPGQVQALTLRDMALTWGTLMITGTGAVTIGADGVPDGDITIKANDWQRMLNIAVAAGAIPQDAIFVAQGMGQLLSLGAADLTLPIKFANGRWSIGPSDLGPAPRFPR